MNNASMSTVLKSYSRRINSNNMEAYKGFDDEQQKCIVVPMYEQTTKVNTINQKSLTDLLAKTFNLVDTEEYREDMTIEEKINYNNHILFQTALIRSVVRRIATITSAVLGVVLTIVLLAIIL